MTAAMKAFGDIEQKILTELNKSEEPAVTPVTTEKPVSPPRLGTPPYKAPPATPVGPLSQSDWWTRSGDFFNKITDDLKDNPYVPIYLDLMRGTAATNANSRTGADTLRYSRLADALNNQYFRTPGQLRSGVVALGGQYTGTQGDYGQLYQMPVETEEQRQQEHVRDYEAVARNAALSRQNIYLGMPIEQARNTLAAELAESSGMSADQRAQIMKMFDYQMSYGSARQATDFAMLAQNYNTILTQWDMTDAQARAISQRMLRDPVWSTLFAQGSNMIAPNSEQYMFLNSIAAQVSKITNPDEQLKRYYSLLAQTTISSFKSIFKVSEEEARKMLDVFKARAGGA